MADHFEVASDAPGFGSRLMNSIKGIFFGLIFFVAAFPVLWWGEGRQNLADFIKQAVLISSDKAPGVAPNALVKTTGRIVSNESVNDEKYLLPHPSLKFLKLSRDVAMYAWKEDKKTEKRGDKEVTTYDYRKEWTGHPADSSRFYDPNGHQNPPMGEEDAAFQVKTAKIGNLAFEADRADLHGSQKLDVNESLMNPSSPSVVQASNGSLYIPYGMQKASMSTRKAASATEVGDLRFEYSYFNNDVDGSLVGDWDGQKIVPHIYKDSHSYLGAFPGSLNAFQSQLQKEHTLMTWIIRLGALFMMWLGLTMMLGPVFTVLESIPVVGGAGGFVIALVCGLIAFTLWVLTILLANLWMVLIVMAVLLIAILIFSKRRKKSAPSTA